MIDFAFFFRKNREKRFESEETLQPEKQAVSPLPVQEQAKAIEKIRRDHNKKYLKAACDDVFCDPESGQLYRSCSPGSYDMKKILLSEGVAALSKNCWGRDGREIIELLVEKHGVECISELFAPYIAFDPEKYTSLGTVFSNPERRLFRSNPPLETYAVVKYVAGVPVEKEEYSPFQTELILRVNMGPLGFFTEQSQTVLEKEFPNKPMRLSDFRVPGTESKELPPVPDERREQIRQMADSFFDEKDPVLQNPSGDTLTDRELAMERLVQFIAAVNHDDFKSSPDYDFVHGISCQNGLLQKKLKYYETSCYDGGSGGTWDHTEWLELKRIKEDWGRICAQNGLSENILSQMEDFYVYQGSLTGDDCQCVTGFWWYRNDQKELPKFDLREGVFLKDPFGLKGIFGFRIYWETV